MQIGNCRQSCTDPEIPLNFNYAVLYVHSLLNVLLQSGNNIERCNAAEVFLDVYPLEKPGTGRAEESSFLEKQQGEMVDLLTDTCSTVRIIAIKVCSFPYAEFVLNSINLLFEFELKIFGDFNLVKFLVLTYK